MTASDSGPSRAEIKALVPDHDATVLLMLTLIARLGRVSDAVAQRLMRPHGLTPAEAAVLMTLWWSGAPHRSSPTTLRASLAQTSGGVTATLRRLERRRFVERIPDAADGRGLLVALTRSGKEAAKRALDDLAAYWSGVLADVPDRATVLRALRTVLDALERAEGLLPTRRFGR